MRRVGPVLKFALNLLLVSGLGGAALAQFSGNVSGVVTDPSGAVVPGAALSLRNLATGEQKVAVSTDRRVSVRQPGPRRL